jgi:hypothetical protein
MTEMPAAVIEMAYDMLEAGAQQLARYDPEKESPLEAAARIYIAMELMRILLEDGVEPTKPELLN